MHYCCHHPSMLPVACRCNPNCTSASIGSQELVLSAQTLRQRSIVRHSCVRVRMCMPCACANMMRSSCCCFLLTFLHQPADQFSEVLKGELQSPHLRALQFASTGQTPTGRARCAFSSFSQRHKLPAWHQSCSLHQWQEQLVRETYKPGHLPRLRDCPLSLAGDSRFRSSAARDQTAEALASRRSRRYAPRQTSEG